MKRTPDRSGIVKIKKWFEWNVCIECRLECRREPMWKIYKGPFFDGKGKTRYCCMGCAPDKATAAAIFTKHLDPTEANRPPAPPAPPAPPSKRHTVPTVMNAHTVRYSP